MRKLLYTFVALSALAAVSCSEKINAPVSPDEAYASVELSSSSVVFPVAGDTKTIFVSTNGYEWTVECDESWLGIETTENSIVFTAGENPDPQGRTAVVIVKAGEGKNTDAVRFKVIQIGNATVDLSAEATANCYIVAPNGTYRFDASVKGNGKADGDGNTKYIETHGIEITGVAYADLVWEATFDGDRTNSAHIIEGYPVYSLDENAVYFTTGTSEGNALISVCAPDGTIQWSWHIWCIAGTPSVSEYNGLTWMDRNLGAVNNVPGDIANRGLFYQWGRKDPFLPSCGAYQEMLPHRLAASDSNPGGETLEEYVAIEAENNARRAVANVRNEQVGDGSGKWSYYEVLAPFSTEAPGNIEFAVNNPTTFMLRARLGNDVTNDWYLAYDGYETVESFGPLYLQSYSALWGVAQGIVKGGADTPATGYKSIFDPCPAGYTVPTQGSYTTLGEDGYVDITSSWTKEKFGWRWTGGNGDYFPLAGYYGGGTYMNFGYTSLACTGEELGYWTAMMTRDVSFGGKTNVLHTYTEDYGFNDVDSTYEQSVNFGTEWYGNAFYDYTSMGARTYGMPLRCVKE